ncbi:hypothetical protein MLD38_031459 [Melastoma candidum]|uniref:Uncharacterized protein n=1 Tax=Melastoma candidum TaxID=119954 RepID=A0ACB9MQB0_9MYRT|nr:hypothetical protein MLD38_031459 [Melastoma candidum]
MRGHRTLLLAQFDYFLGGYLRKDAVLSRGFSGHGFEMPGSHRHGSRRGIGGSPTRNSLRKGPRTHDQRDTINISIRHAFCCLNRTLTHSYLPRKVPSGLN